MTKKVPPKTKAQEPKAQPKAQAQKGRNISAQGNALGNASPEDQSPEGARHLPEGWRWVTLREIANIAGGVTKGQKRRPNEVIRKVPYAIAESLLRAPGGCVLWVCYSKETLQLTHFHLFDCGTHGLSEEAIMDLPQATKRKKTGKVARKGYRQLRIKDAQHQDLDLPRLANRLFNL